MAGDGDRLLAEQRRRVDIRGIYGVCVVADVLPSDMIESQTGAWWNPWWLAALKCICLIGLVGCGLWAWRIKRIRPVTGPQSQDGDSPQA